MNIHEVEAFATDCRICSKNDAECYISVFDEILSTQIVDLLRELTFQKMYLDGEASTLICTNCANGLRQAIKIKRQYVKNETLLKNPHLEDPNEDLDPFLSDDVVLEFVEKPPPPDPTLVQESRVSTEVIASSYRKMKIEIFDDDMLEDDPLFNDDVSLEFPSNEKILQSRIEKLEIANALKSVKKEREVLVAEIEEEKEISYMIIPESQADGNESMVVALDQNQNDEKSEEEEEEEEVYSADDTDDEEFFIDENLISKKEPDLESLNILTVKKYGNKAVAVAPKQLQAPPKPSDNSKKRPNEKPDVENPKKPHKAAKLPEKSDEDFENYEGMNISCEDSIADVEPETPPTPVKLTRKRKRPEPTLSISFVRPPPARIDRVSVLEIPVEDLKFSCCMCRHICQTEDELKTHLYEHPERVRRRSFLSLYQKAITGIKKKPGTECVKCLRTIDMAKMTYHLKYHYVKKKFVCGGCGERFGFYSELKLHEKKCVALGKVSTQQEYMCNICDKVLMSKATLQRHIHSQHEMTEEEKVQYKCNLCGKGYPSPKNLKEHVKTHTQTSTFPCSLCEKSFKCKINLEIHLRVHFNERIYKCNYCEKSYIHYTDRRRHEFSVHTGERPHKCEVCGEGFVKKYSLTLHVRKQHTGEKPYECDLCEEAFIQGSQLKHHKIKKHQENLIILDPAEVEVERSKTSQSPPIEVQDTYEYEITEITN